MIVHERDTNKDSNMTESTMMMIVHCIKRKERSLATTVSNSRNKSSSSKKRRLNQGVSVVLPAVPPPAVVVQKVVVAADGIEAATATITPDACAASIFQKNGVDVRHESLMEKIVFVKPTNAMIDSYTSEKLRLVRQNDLPSLRALHDKGESLDCCNRFGESLLGLALRRGCIDIVQFLVTEAKVNLLVRDDYGRTALHDAMWTPEPQLPQVLLLLQHTPEFLSLRDVRGHTPLNYTRKEHWGIWKTFLQQHESLLVARLTTTSSSTTTVTTTVSTTLSSSS
jgi:Ankyrin repeats (3 copies)